MSNTEDPIALEIRPAVPEDADGIAAIFLESAEHHVALDPERYAMPAAEGIAARYRSRQQHPSDQDHKSITLVAALSGVVVGFVDARLEKSSDGMHREMIYCHISEIAVRRGHRSQGIQELIPTTRPS